ncbi:MAG: hypothetical protein JWO31_360, partial [Phycisphaerales bacterium]|nr:hypothetical protein [Phycisphaerales bacterium]
DRVLERIPESPVGARVAAADDDKV